MGRGQSRPVCFALTGTPGTGKSSVAALLPKAWNPYEVGAMALTLNAGHRIRGGIEVDLPRLTRSFTRLRATSRPRVVVGHLAHLLPVDAAIVLRCHPLELQRRLAPRPSRAARSLGANGLAEATDVVLFEALERFDRVWEVDTTGRSPRTVARSVARIVRHPGMPRYGRIDWLGDPRVTAHLLDREP